MGGWIRTQIQVTDIILTAFRIATTSTTESFLLNHPMPGFLISHTNKLVVPLISRAIKQVFLKYRGNVARNDLNNGKNFLLHQKSSRQAAPGQVNSKTQILSIFLLCHLEHVNIILGLTSFMVARWFGCFQLPDLEAASSQVLLFRKHFSDSLLPGQQTSLTSLASISTNAHYKNQFLARRMRLALLV